MDPIATLWFASLAGAAGFTATGVFLARMLDGARKEATAPAPAPAETTAEPTETAKPEVAERFVALEAQLEAAVETTKTAEAGEWRSILWRRPDTPA